MVIYSLPNNNILDWPKINAFANDQILYDTKKHPEIC